MKSILLCMLLALCAGVVSCSAQEAKSDSKSDAKKEETKEPKKADPTPSKSEEVAVIKTSLGEMVVEFWPDVAPKTVENFKNLAKTNFYDGTLFHRIIKGFMIQGGDPNTKKAGMESQWGMGGPGYGVKAEFNPRKHTRGVLSMARSNDPNSAGSQFFICLGDAGFLDGKYTAFGKVIKGDDVLEKLGNTKVGPGNTGDQQDSRPVDRVSLDSIRIVPASSAK